MNLADHVRKFVRKWLDGKRENGMRGRDFARRQGACAFPVSSPEGPLQSIDTQWAAEGRPSVFGSVPLREQALDGAETKNSQLHGNWLCINDLR